MFYYKNIFILISLYTSLVKSIDSNARQNASERDLMEHVMKDYSPHIRPVRNYYQVINVTVQPQIYSLVDVDEIQEQIKLLIWFPQSWTDEFLTWDPEDWGGIEKMNLPISQIWLPDGYIFNTVDTTDPLTQHNARVRYDGNVEVDFNKLVVVTCPMSVLDFPFDNQVCNLQFGSWSYQTHQLNFIVKTTFVPKNAQNSEWDIISFDGEKKKTQYENTEGGMYEYEEIFYYLKLKRKPLYYVIVIIVPSFLIVTVSCIGIFTPHGVQGDREEKVSLGLTTMLTMSVILDMVTSQMPKSSEGVPLLGRYVLIEFVISIAAVLVSILIIFLHERTGYMRTPPPRWLRRFFNIDDYHLDVEEHIQAKTCETVEEIRNCISMLRTFIEDQETTEEIRIIWQRVFSWADLLSMVFFVIVNFIVTYTTFMNYTLE
ncbi:unnamed protein product [Auanema sp. JU1783]|nr:unnamed protein product [Auanema sp. JU1783]